MNENLTLLQAYPFERLAQLLSHAKPPAQLHDISLAMGEPGHKPMPEVLQALCQNRHDIGKYPITKGLPALREGIAQWLTKRYHLTPGQLDPEHHVIPVNGTREALFAIAQCMITANKNKTVIFPNPFYQIYEGATVLAGAKPYMLNTLSDNDYQIDIQNIPQKVWKETELIYICSPGNPTGAILDRPCLQQLIELAQHYNFIIAADECYSEIYPNEQMAPVGLLQVATEMGNHSFKQCLVFNSLSKRSNLPGLRSGFVAGDKALIEPFLLYRTYHGSAMPYHHQKASLIAWQDEAHVIANRVFYREKFQAVEQILAPVLRMNQPQAGFYYWPETPIDDITFSAKLYADYNVKVLPGQYLSRQEHSINPGKNHIRMALVPSHDDCIEAAQRIKQCIQNL